MANDATAITMNVSLPIRLKQYVDGRVASGLYASASEFIREAVREKLQREQELQQANSVLAGKLLEGLDSGQPLTFTPGHFAHKKHALIERHKGRKKQP